MVVQQKKDGSVILRFKYFMILLVCALMVTAASLNYKGYCFTDKSFHGDRFFKIAAIDSALDSINFGKIKTEFSPNPPPLDQQYISGAQYLLSNPDCCKFINNWRDFKGEGWFLPSFLGRLLGSEFTTVEVNYYGKKQNSVVYDVVAQRYIYALVGNCGNIKQI